MALICGIDPGKSGAICILNSDKKTCYYLKTPVKKVGLLDMDLLARMLYEVDGIYMEKVGGRKGWGATQTFNFGSIYGQTWLAISHLPHKLVTPATWQKAAHDGISTSLSAKERTKAAFMTQNPSAPKLHDGIMDAFFIGSYGLKQHSKIFLFDWEFKKWENQGLSL